MRTSDFDFELPDELIAQGPAPRREGSRLLVLHRAEDRIEHRQFVHLPDYLRAGDVLVLNNSRVIPARLRGVNKSTGGSFEVLLLEEHSPNEWEVLLKPGRRARLHTVMAFKHRAGPITSIEATVTDLGVAGHRRLRFSGTENILQALGELGEVPLPPYIRRPSGADLSADVLRYQTVYATRDGSVAAPTAGLHFTPELLADLPQRGVHVCDLTLHVGWGTFAPVKAERLQAHVMHEERFTVGEAAAHTINAAKREGRRVIAVGTTTVRTLESVAAVHAGQVVPGPGRTKLFLYPPCEFRIADALLTNFHLPRSTLLMLVSAFAAPGNTAGRARVLRAYAEAVRARYRFFSYGDAMLVL